MKMFMAFGVEKRTGEIVVLMGKISILLPAIIELEGQTGLEL